MKKIILAAAVAAISSLSSNAQDLYATGNFEASSWNPKAPVVFDKTADGYSITIEGVSSLKISTAMGDWPAFNAGAVQLEADPKTPGTYALVSGDANISLPWQGDWTFVVNNEVTEITLSTTTPEPTSFTIYLRGDINDWKIGDEWLFKTDDDVNYYLKNVFVGEGKWKIADENWGPINYGPGGEVLIDVPTEFQSNGGDAWISYDAEPCNVDINFNIETHEVTVTEAPVTGIEAISADGAAAVYYNLQGVRVDNPKAGLYITKTGNKTTKVYIK